MVMKQRIHDLSRFESGQTTGGSRITFADVRLFRNDQT